MIGGIIGQIIHAIPFVVVAILLASLIECFLVLPGHLRSAFVRTGRRQSRFRRWFDRGFGRFRDGPFRRLLTTCVAWRYATMATALTAFILCVGMILGGRVGFNFFPTPESDWIFANVAFTAGTPRRQTQAMVDVIERAAYRAEQELGAARGTLVKLTLAKVGTRVGNEPTLSGAAGDHLGGIALELVTADRRDVRTDAFVRAWRPLYLKRS